LGSHWLCLWAVAWCAASTPLHGLSYAFDSFEDYAPGSIAGNNGGTGWGGAWSANAGQAIIDTSANKMTYQVPGGAFIDGGNRALQVTSNNNNMTTRSLDSSYSGTLYNSFLMRIDAGSLSNNMFLSVNYEGQNGPAMGLKVNQGGGSGPEDFFARPKQSGNAAAYSTNAQVGSTYFLVGKLEKTGASTHYNRYSLWVNPDSSDTGSTPDAVFTDTSSFSSLDEIGMRSVNFANGLAVSVDALRYTSTFSEAVSGLPSNPVPFGVNPFAGIFVATFLVGCEVRCRRKALAATDG